MVVAQLPTCSSFAARTSGRQRGFTGTPLRPERVSPSRGTRQPNVTVVSGVKVAVSGAGGRTGSLVMKKLAEQQGDVFYTPTGLCRSQKSKDALGKKLGDGVAWIPIEGTIGDTKSLKELCENQDALVILTSAVPKPKIVSIVMALVSKLLPWMENQKPQFSYQEGGSPEMVDWLGQKAQIDAAIASGTVKKIVLCSSSEYYDRFSPHYPIPYITPPRSIAKLGLSEPYTLYPNPCTLVPSRINTLILTFIARHTD
jgi:hypothetical protein